VAPLSPSRVEDGARHRCDRAQARVPGGEAPGGTFAPVIAALLGVRVATTRASGRFAWSAASVLWWAIFLVPAALLVTLILLLVLVIAPH
jgi:hypothetical protein